MNTQKAIMGKTFKRYGKNWPLYLMLLPGIVYIFIFHYIPMYGVTIAFKDFYASKGILGSPWVGLENFQRVFNSPDFLRLIWNTLSLSLYQLILTFPIPIILALMINSSSSKKFGTFIQNLTYAPYFISTVVLVGMMLVIFSNNGIANTLLKKLGMDAQLFMGEAKYFKNMFVFSSVWQTTGWSSIIYLAALAGVNTELHEAASIDGASKLKRVLHIDFPHILPTAVIVLTLNVGKIMSLGFEKAYLMQTTLNISVSEILSTYVYKKGLLDIDYSYSAAIGLFNNVINLVLLLSVNRVSKKLTDTGLW